MTYLNDMTGSLLILFVLVFKVLPASHIVNEYLIFFCTYHCGPTGWPTLMPPEHSFVHLSLWPAWPPPWPGQLMMAGLWNEPPLHLSVTR